MREATEGFYADRNMFRGWGEVMPSPDMALSVRKITRHCSERIARRAFEGVPIRVAYREKRRGRKKPGEGREAREAPDAPADGDDDVDFD